MVNLLRAVRNTSIWIGLTLVSVAQQPTGVQAGQAAGTFRTNSNLVTIDVVVTDQGHPVKGLSRESFHLLENGKEQEIKIFEEHSMAADNSAAASEAILPAHTYTNAVAVSGPPNVLLLDALNTPVKDQQYLRKQMVAYLKELPAGTRIAIFTLGTRLRMVQGFTTDVAVLTAAMDSRRAAIDNSALLQQQQDLATPLDSSTNNNALDVLDQFQAEATTFHYDVRVENTLAAMKQLGAFLGGLPGRKDIVWLSGSFPLSLDSDESANNPYITQRSYSEQLRQISDAFTADRIAVYPVDVRGVLPPTMFDAGSSDGLTAGPPMRRAGRPSAPSFARAQNQFFSETAAEHGSMQQLAEETGGHAFYETNALKQAIARAVEDGASYYTLTYTPQNKDFNGKFRKIEMRLASPDYQLAYRRGYYARPSNAREVKVPDALISPKHPAIQRGAPAALQVQFKARVLTADDPLLKDFHPRPGPAGMANVKVPVTRYCVDYAITMREIDAELASDRLYHSGLELLAIAYDPDGKVLNLVDHPFQLNLKPEEYDKLLHDGLQLHEEIDVPSGEVYLRLAVHDLMTDHLGSLEVPLVTDSRQKKR